MVVARSVLLAAVLGLGAQAFYSGAATQRSRVSSRAGSSVLPSRTACNARNARRIDSAKKAAAGLAMAGIGALAASTAAPPAMADVSGLTKCSENAAFKRRETKEVKSLEKQLSKTKKDSPGALELQNRIDRTKRRFAAYSKTSLLCGSDGLPHLIVGPEFVGHEGEFAIPGLGFLYITGWIGWAGRTYLRGNRNTNSKPTEGEIILDVPAMSKAILAGGAWPFELTKEIQKGDFAQKVEDVTVAPKDLKLGK
eukprot:CAMPEP_0167745172 /NCGR_PEP_ID=MMETSP0110_2-20121227/3004_1 /TAXON_ID=629695 /ORGANISM="Gymnochlora sp., Strain CCMP2014" /LENGTH=252 /DNA_ID=CAMNT_0007629785 /DNA_START=30 /DNA_END=788 /DNA_ORIENTATION=-